MWWIAAALWLLALGAYVVMTTLIVARAVADRFDPAGSTPDSWILMGGLAIATLAGVRLHRTAPVPALHDVTLTATVVTWVCAVLWIPMLVYFGLRRANTVPGSLGYTGTWWAMVFPLGMFSAATHAVGRETGMAALGTVSLVFFWIAFSVWLIVAVAWVGSRRPVT